MNPNTDPAAATMRDITTVLRSYAEQIPVVLSVPNLKQILRDAAGVIDEQDAEIIRLQSLVDEYERPKA